MTKNDICTNSLFETSWWLNAVAFGNWEEILINENGNIVARWAYVKVNNKIIIPKYSQTMGIWFAKDILDNDSNYRRRKELLIKLIKQLPNVSNIKIYLDPQNTYFLPFFWAGFLIVPKITYRISTLNDIDEVYNKFSKNTQRDIKQAYKKVKVEESEDVELLIQLILNNYSRQHRKYVVQPHQIRLIYSTCRQNSACKLLAARDINNRIHSMSLFVYDKRVCYYLLAGNQQELNAKSCSNTLLIWEGIKLASVVSCIFDFEGSMTENIESFFRKFGAIPTPYYEIRKQSLFHEIFELIKPKIKKILKHK